jgi:hypothetical protein
MTALGLLDRVKGWLGHRNGHDAGARTSPKRYSLGPAGDTTGVISPRAAAAIASLAAARDPRRGAALKPDAPFDPGAEVSGDVLAGQISLRPSSPDPGPSPLAPRPAPLDPLDPEWAVALDDLPARMADAAAGSAAGLRSLEQIETELEGHRQATRTIAAAVRRLPDLAVNQAELARETNRQLERQGLVLESMLDGILSLRAGLKSTEDSARRHLKAIAVLESAHRQVIFEYQVMFQRAHRQVGILAAVAVMLAAVAIGGVAYVAWVVFSGG